MTDRELLELLLNKVTGMEERFTGIEERFTGMEEQINHIKETMATKDDVAELPYIKRAVRDTADAVIRIEATQEQHEHTLDLLARRSIDQEAELKRIK